MTNPASPKFPPLPSKLILTSTKAYFSPRRTISYLESILDPSSGILPLLEASAQDVRFVLIPDHLTIHPCASILDARYPAPSSASLTSNTDSTNTDDDVTDPSHWPISLGAQNAFQSTSYGAFTGEIVAPALRSLGCTVVELNHAERRRLLGETDATSAQRAAAAAALGMVPLVCIGELERPDLAGPMSRSVGVAVEQLRPQMASVLGAVDRDAPVIFAYEPVWAIGAAEPAGVSYVGPVVNAIRDLARQLRPDGAEVKVVYGGSAGPGLWSGRTSATGEGLGKYVDGLFLGRFAHKIEGVRGVVEEVVESLRR